MSLNSLVEFDDPSLCLLSDKAKLHECSDRSEQIVREALLRLIDETFTILEE